MDQIPLPQDFKDLLNLPHAHGVRHLLIGGWEDDFHGYPRNTADIDIWTEVTPKNAKAMSEALKEFIGTAPPPEHILKRPYILRIGVPPNRVEILTDIQGVDFDDCDPRRVDAMHDGTPVSLIGLKERLPNQRAAGRGTDLADVNHLVKYHQLEKRKTKK